MTVEYSITTPSWDLSLADSEIHVWRAALRQPTEIVKNLSSLLSADEKSRVERFHFQHLRNSFIVARGILRMLLASYLNLAPHQVEFEYEPAGKPTLSERLEKKIFFNLSHSHEIVIYAFSHIKNVGIDVEHVRPLDDLMQIAERNFSTHEIAQLKTLRAERTLEGFFNCWTRKEAYVKAIGNGFSYPLQQFDVSLKPGEPAKLLCILGSEQEAASWSMFQLHPEDGYAAALAVEGKGGKVSQYEWSRFSFRDGLQERI